MAITKHDIDNVSLKIVQEGYDPEEVDLLLERIAEEVDAFNRALIEAASRIDAAEARARAAEQQAAQSAHVAQSSQNSAQTAANERQIAQALIAAQKSADELREAAKVESENTCCEAEKRARDIVREALSEKQRIIDEVDRLRESTESFRSEYIAVLSRFTTEAQKVMPKLEEARPNIEAEKKSTAEVMQAIKEGDASAATREPEAIDFAGASATQDPPARSDNYGKTPPSRPAQSAFEIDEDLDIDIEEID
ncbi:MAG: DivIVA domain-containing protein [Coriobacteriia bacterium]|nr:DivIVA domain-containing protein [Coriobacteriia bacterium]